MKEVKLTIPDRWSDITIETYQKYVKIQGGKGSEKTKVLKSLALLCNTTPVVVKKMAYKDRQVVKRGSLEDGDDVDMIYDLDTGNVSINVAPKKGTYETGSGAYNKEYSLDYQRGDVIEEGPYAGQRGPGEFGVAEGRPIQTGADDFDIDYDQYLDVDDAMSDLTELEAFAKNKSTKQIHKQKGTKKKDIFPDYDPPEYDPN